MDKALIKDKFFDTDYTKQVPDWGFVFSDISTNQENNDNIQNENNLQNEDNLSNNETNKIEIEQQSGWLPDIEEIKKSSEELKKSSKETKTTKTTKKNKDGQSESFFDKLIKSIFPSTSSTKKDTAKKDNKNDGANWKDNNKTEKLAKDPLKLQVQKILELPDKEYSDSKLTSQLRKYIKEVEDHYSTVVTDYKTHIAPSYREFKWVNFNVSWLLWKSYYVQSYPSYIDALRTRDIFSFYSKRDMSFFIYPEDDAAMQTMLKQKATQLKAQINESLQKWITLDTEIEQQYRDVEMIRQKLTTREERYFETSYYMNIYNEKEDKLKEISRKFEQKIWWYGIRVKPAIQRMDEWFSSTLPVCKDDLGIGRSAVTSSLAGSFPFISNDLVAETGILYGINSSTGSLVVFDRFNSSLPNMNSIILATSGAGKSFTVKLEIIRYLINWIDCIVIDPENEYKQLCEKMGGSYINVATSSQQYINPFDIPPKIEDVEYGEGDLLRSQIMSLIGLIKLLIWELNAKQEAVLDKALQNTYLLKWFGMNTNDYEGKQSPLMEDLLNVLEGMTWWEDIALKLSKYVSGTFWKLFNNYTNIDINNPLTVFSIRDLEDSLKTPAMFNVLNYIWTKIRTHKKQRLLAVDEAWIMLKHKESAEFLFGLIKRARKYWLWITTISQDIEDFANSEYGKPIISNSWLQLLLKQSTTSIKTLADMLGLSEAEQRLLVGAGIWEWLIFAGPQHVWVKILASPSEKAFISTDV